jgi:hypothetical protein
MNPFHLALAEQAPGMQHAISMLFERLRNGEDLRLPEEVALPAGKEHHEYMCAKEGRLDSALLALYGSRIAPESDLERIFITEGICDVTGRVVKRRTVIGRDALVQDFEDRLMSPNERLSDQYRPLCFLCKDKDGPTTHPTNLSYTRYMVSTLVPAFDSVHMSEMEIAKLEAELDRLKNKHKGRIPDKEFHKLAGRIEGWQKINEEYCDARERQLAMMENDILFLSSRVKGSIAEKTLQIATGMRKPSSYNVRYKGQILDLFGTKVVTKDGCQEKVAEYTKERAVSQFGGECILNDIGEVVKGGHKSIRLLARYEDFPIEFQFQSFAEYEEDRADHRRYKLSFIQKQREARMAGVPVDALRAELYRIFHYTG